MVVWFYGCMVLYFYRSNVFICKGEIHLGTSGSEYLLFGTINDSSNYSMLILDVKCMGYVFVSFPLVCKFLCMD